ncbi:GumC domain-containing protein [Membranihabitans marinus]|uniref:hypothetical protein n=1 Tax=Membranihabitans marinus TaxID=1227546 RepID=UPI001F394B2B|nr:hypothetical protein [Membranihabitans marinus]
MKNPPNSFLPIARFIWQQRRPLFITLALSGICGVIISLLLPVYYQSSATLYPAEINYVESTDLLYRKGNLNDFGDIREAEQLLELLESQDFKMKIIDSFNLYDHYDISPEVANPVYQILGKYNDLIHAERSKFNAINLTVKDKDPVMAANMVNGIIEELNRFMNVVISTRIESHYNKSQHTRDSLNQYFNLLQDSMQILQSKGLVGEYERAALYEASGNIKGDNPTVKSMMEQNKQFGNQFDILQNELYFVQSQIHTLDKILLQLGTNISQNTAQLFVFDKGHIPDHKHSPKRLIVVILTMFFATMAMLTYILFKKYWPSIREQINS